MDPTREDLSTIVESPRATAVKVIQFALAVVEGPETGAQLLIDGSRPPPILIGTSPVCDLCLRDPTVSRRHVALDLCADQLRVMDLGSTNGTLVETVRVTEAWLRGGETLRLGRTALRVLAGPARELALTEATQFGLTLGSSAEMRQLFTLFERMAASDIPVIIEGETGTGKEVLAESLHRAGPRSAGPFVVFDCTSVPGTLLESELFGHEKGAFTGALTSRKGVFEQADGGTLLIDEIGDLETALQAKLLRAIERSEVRPLGGTRTRSVDVRILAATRRDLDREVQAGRFRDDLFHRLAVGRIELPPLRRRKGDVRFLANHFAQRIGDGSARLPERLVAQWEDSPWPGNIRELRNAVARYLALGEDGTSRAKQDPAHGADSPAAGDRSAAVRVDATVEDILAQRLPLAEARDRMMLEFSRRYLQRAMEEHGGNVTRAAAAAGVAKRYFQLLRAKLLGDGGDASDPG